MNRAFFVGFDFGTTTSACVLGSAAIVKNAVSGRMEFSDYRIELAPDPRFTPFDAGAAIDLLALDRMIDQWLREIEAHTDAELHGGAIVTGLCARAGNASQVRSVLEARLSQVILATIADPRLESRLSFQGSVQALSREHPDRVFLNFDIGGGTTNIALGRTGDVIDSASLFVGARHVEYRPGTYELIRRSEWAKRLPAEPTAIVATWVSWLEDVVRTGRLPDGFVESPFHGRVPPGELVTTFSGGVGELIYANRPFSTTQFGDLGGELARAIVESPVLNRHIASFVPKNRGRATVIGLAMHNQDLSGSSVFVGKGVRLPLTDVVVVGRLSMESTETDLERLVSNGRSLSRGAAIWVELPESLSDLERFAGRLQTAVYALPGPVVFLTAQNLGKTFGNLVAGWDAGRPLVVLDELTVRDGQFVHVGPPAKGVIPVAFYGMG